MRRPQRGFKGLKLGYCCCVVPSVANGGKTLASRAFHCMIVRGKKELE